MPDATPLAALQARDLVLEGSAGTPFNAAFAPGLSLLIDAEGEVKTRLLAVLAGAAAAHRGTVHWRGQPLRAALATDAALCFWRDPRSPWPEVSPRQWARQLVGRYPSWNETAWQAHADGLHLAEHLDKEMFRISTGGKRKVLLAAALASGAPLTLIDEPEAALDWPSIRYLREALAPVAATDRVVVVGNYEDIDGVAWRQVIRL